MLNTKQPKKSNSIIKYSLRNDPANSNNIVGKSIKKNQHIKEKLHKNLSQFPIAPLNDSKQNASLSNLMVPRPHSSLIASDISRSPSKTKQKYDINSFCKDKINLKKISSKRNTLGVIESQIKQRRQSGTSLSHHKYNNRSVEEDSNAIKFMLAQNRKKYNLSCGDAIDDKSVSKSKAKQIKNLGRGKKKSMVAANKKNSKGQSKKNIKKILLQNQGKKFKQININSKSKGNTSTININLGRQKKKQNKENKQNKQKRSKSKSKSKSKQIKSNKMFVVSREDSENEKQMQEQEYPVNKYFNAKKKQKNLLNIKVGLNNTNNFNNVSCSSGLYGDPSRSNQPSVDRTKFKQSIMIEEEQDPSINLQEIKFYEEHSPLRRKKQIKFLKIRQQITYELQEQYPYLNSAELNFLSSVIIIQRKWREHRLHKQLNVRRQIITQYIAQDLQLSKVSKHSKNKPTQKQQSKLGEKTQMLSRTKLGEFDNSQTKNEISNNKKEIDSEQMQTRKNSIKHQVIVNQNKQTQKKQNGNRSKQMEQQQSLTDRKPMSEDHSKKVIVNYSWILSRQIFPQIGYLQYRRNFIREQFQKIMKSIHQSRLSKEINEKQFEVRKKQATRQYAKQMQTLKKSKHDIKKGYLKYIDCINKVKEINDPHQSNNKHSNKYGLRKVSSESNFLSTLYQKIFKFDKVISEWSGGSQSIQLLTKKILIRKQHIKADRRSLSDIRSAARSSYEMIRSSRQPSSSALLVFQNTDRLVNLLTNDKQSWSQANQNESKSKIMKQFKFSSQIFSNDQEKRISEIKSSRENVISQFSIKKQINEQRLSIKNLANSTPLLKPTEAILQKVQELVFIQLAKQLERDIHKINPVLMDLILINQPSFSNYEEVYEGEQEQQYDDSSPAHQFIHKQLQSMGSPRNILTARKLHTTTEPEQILSYLNQLILFIKDQKWIPDIIFNMNNAQTFEPLAYLKFLRDFQIPQDQFVPIISNQRFIEWESFYNQNFNQQNQNILPYSSSQQIYKQCQTIFHRCIFQVFLGQLQRNRPYGERGRPFPWEQKYSPLTIRQIPIQNVGHIFQKTISKIQQLLIYKCGIITEKHYIKNQEQLEMAHEKNEDRIIQMLEQDLIQSPHMWYQLDEHLLQIKLQITYLLEQELISQLVENFPQIRH